MPTSYPYFYSPVDCWVINRLCSFFRDKSDLFFEGFVKFNLYANYYPMSEYILPFLPPSTITLPIFIPPINNNDSLFSDIRDFYCDMFSRFSEYIFGNVVRISSADNFVFASGSSFFNASGNSITRLSPEKVFDITLPQNSYFEGSYYAIVLCDFRIRDLPSQSDKSLWSLISPTNYERVIKAFYNCRGDFSYIYPICSQVVPGVNYKFSFLPDRILINAHKNSEISPQGNLLLMYTYIPKVVVHSKNSSTILELGLPDSLLTWWDGTTSPQIVEFIRYFMDFLYSEELVSYNYENYNSEWELSLVTFTSHASIWGYIKPISDNDPVRIGLPSFEPFPISVPTGGKYGRYGGSG